MRASIHVCRSCAGRAAVRAADPEAAGLPAALHAMLGALPGGNAFTVVPQACMGPCGDGQRVALTAPGRWGWLFQGLEAGDMATFARFLAAWRDSPDGVPAKASRPAGLAPRLVGRLPPSGAA